jgi:pyruvate/2-oxoglutarate dehydrogenase complex dihydrolipoamide acyltransferase (E2) component
MNETTGQYHVVELPIGRQIWLNALDAPGPKHWMYGLLEVDVTVAQRHIEQYRKRAGEVLSFTGFLIYCLARAVDENKEVQAYLKGRKHLMMFDDVNVGTMIEHKVGEESHLMGHIIQAANRKTYQEIHDEIRAIQNAPVPANRGMPDWFRMVMRLPWPLSGLAKELLGLATNRNPALRIAATGTVFVSAVGMFGKGHSGWGISTTPHSLSLVVGSMSQKPAVVEGQIVPRDILNLTVLFDHEVVDGAPATRFVKRLVELIESGYGLNSMESP